MLFRDTNSGCFNCGAQTPNTVVETSERALLLYECPDCHDRILSGIIQRDGIPERVPIRVPPWIPDEATILPRGGWSTWEVWWTAAGTYVSLINGRVVAGNYKFYDHVQKIRELSQ